jgi:membrane protease YdiL (CAAX protease family)
LTSSVRRVALFVLGYLFVLLAASVPKGMAPRRYADLVWGVVASLTLLALTRLFLARESRSFRDVGLAPDARSGWRLLGGAAIGVTVYAATLAIISSTVGPIQLTASTRPTASAWTLTLASYLALSCMEELGFRAYALRTLVPAVGAWRAQLGLALAFGASHLLFGWSWSTIVLGVIPSALLFGVVALRSGGLAMPIGLHAALNVAQWLVGAKDVPGIWTISADSAHTARLSTFAPWIGAGVTLLAAVVLAWNDGARRSSLPDPALASRSDP